MRVTGNLRKAGETEERITAAASWQDAPFTDVERVALELVEAVLTPNPFGERVSDALYAKASTHYDDEALWTLTLAIGHFCLSPSLSSASRSPVVPRTHPERGQLGTRMALHPSPGLDRRRRPDPSRRRGREHVRVEGRRH